MTSSKSDPDKNPVPKAAYSVPGFCKAHDISRSFFYTLIKEGQGPVTMKVRGRRLISTESAADWRRRMESIDPTASTNQANQGKRPGAVRGHHRR